MDLGELIRRVHDTHPAMPVLHIGAPVIGVPVSVVNLPDTFTAESLLRAVTGLIRQHSLARPA
jgi:hypothetical protein